MAITYSDETIVDNKKRPKNGKPEWFRLTNGIDFVKEDGTVVGQMDKNGNLTLTANLTVTGAVAITGSVTGAFTGGKFPVVAVSADGAITIPSVPTDYFITKAGVAAMTIADPTATTHDGVRLVFMATTANAHTLSNAAGSGFFSSGGSSKDVATFGGAIGDRITIVAYQGKWYIEDSLNITLG